METKSAPLLEIKTNSTAGEFTAIIAAIGNVDLQGDRVMQGAFKSAIENDPTPPTYWAHKYDIPPIGEGLDWKEVGNEVHYEGRLFVKGDVEHQYANMVYAGMKSYDGRAPAIRQFSYTYGVPEGGSEMVELEGKSVRNLIEIRPVAEVGPCFIGANPETRLLAAAKAAIESGADPALFDASMTTAFTSEFDFFQLTKTGDWSKDYVDSLPDSAFLHITAGGERDETGRSARDERFFPYKTAQDKIDMPHLRKAIAEAPGTEALDEEIRAKVSERAQKLLRSQEGKALLLGSIYSSKAWDDIEGYAVRNILEMLDCAVAYIQIEEDLDDVTEMRGIAASLLALLRRDFAQAYDGSTAKSAVGIAASLYEAAAEVEMTSDVTLTVDDQELARLLNARPTH